MNINSYRIVPGKFTYWGDIVGNISEQTDLVEYISTHGGGGGTGDAVWGGITGSISNQSDLMNLVSSYATQSWVESQGYLTSHQDLTGYATQSWVESQGYLTSHQDLTGYATESWVSSQQFITSVALTGYATESWVSSQQFATQSWVSSQGYVNNSQVVSIFNDCNPLVYDMSNPLTYLESHSVLKYDMASEDHLTNPLVLGYWVNGQPNSTISNYDTVELEGPEFVKKNYQVIFDSRTGQVTSVEETGNMYLCWLDAGSYPLMMTYNIGEETGSPTDWGVVWATDYEYGILIGVNPTGVDGEFEGVRIDHEGVIGRYVVTGEEDEETGEMTYTDEMYPFATESWVTEQITNSIGSAMSITNQILS